MNLRIVPIDWHPRYSYAIAGLKVNGKRKRLYFKSAPEAKTELDRLKIKARQQGEAGLNLSDALRAEAAEATRRLKPYGKRIGDAVDFYLNHLKAEESAATGKLAEDYLRRQERSKLSVKHLADLHSRLGRFAETFGERSVRTLSAAEIEEWLYAHNLEPQTLVNWRSALHAFFGWLLHQKLVEFNPVAGVAKPKIVASAPAIWAPSDLRRLLKAAPLELVPVLAIGAFAGLRTAELLRLSWSEVALERGFIEITAGEAKSSRRRLVKIEPNLAEWLAPYTGRTGSVWALGWRSYHEATARLCGELGLEWPENGLRHSFASYHLAHFQGAETLALQMGHTGARMIFDHYREVVTPEQAARYWEVAP